jgi:hypothetical protein
MNMGADYVVICLDSINSNTQRKQVVKKLESLNKEIIAISIPQMYDFCGNILQVKTQNNKYKIIMSEHAYKAFKPSQLNQLLKFGGIVSVNVSTIENVGGGSARCMMAEIFLPKQKEPRYFDRSTFYDFEDDYITKILNEYLNFYNTSEAIESKYKMDASVFNMYSQQSIDDILKLSPDAKFIIILRDPVDASLSMHRQRLTYVDKTMREVSEDFNECWNLLEKRKEGQGYPKGCRNKFLFRYDLLYSYENYLPYLREKLKNKLFIGFYEDYKNKPDKFFEKLFSFLEIEPIKIENKKINESLVIKDSFLLNILEYI